MLLYAIAILITHSFTVQSALICESEFCVCRHNNRKESDSIGDVITCSYNPNVLKRDFDLPSTVYVLNLSRNNLSSILPSSLLKSTSLAELYLNNNRIAEVKSGALRMPNLKRLDLSDNELKHVDENAFQYIKSLDYLNLANNWFTSFEMISFHHLGNLVELVLDNNELGASLEDNNLFDRSGYGLTHKIKSLSISGIDLKRVHDNFFVDVYDLKRLDISNNHIAELFELPFTLEYLDLSGNPITQISGEDFTDLVALKELKLNSLRIQEIPDYAFSSLHALTSLELERNANLTIFSTTAFGHEVLDDADDFVLEKLSFKGSRLTTLDDKLQVPFSQLVKLDLQGNFWNCDCNLVWIKKLQIQPKDYEHLRCFKPTPLYNSRIFDLKPRFFSCPAHAKHIGIVVAVACLCILLSSIAIWIFLFLPKYHSRCRFLQNMATPSAGYSVLPVHANFRTL